MEPSSIDELTVELFRCLRAARRKESLLSLNTLADLIGENLEVGEHLLLADLLVEYERTRLATEIGA